MFYWVYFSYLFFYSVSLFSIQDRDLFFLSNVNFFILKVSLYAYVWIFPFVLFILHVRFLTKGKCEEIFFSSYDYNLLSLYIPPHKNKFIQNTQFLFYNIILVITLSIDILLMYMAPIFLLCFTMIQFSKIQNLLLDWYHFILLILDTWFVILYIFYQKRRGISPLLMPYIDEIFRFSLKYIFYPFLGVILLFSFVNFYFSNSILLTKENREIQTYTLNTIFQVFNPLFYETSEEYSFLFPRLNLEYQNLVDEKNIYFYKRNFRYANFKGAKLNFLSFDSANTNFANFKEVKWE